MKPHLPLKFVFFLNTSLDMVSVDQLLLFSVALVVVFTPKLLMLVLILLEKLLLDLKKTLH
jgi:hypothetical protein